MPEGKVQLDFKRPWSDGTNAVVLAAHAFIARLAAIIPPPRRHVTRYFGVLTAHSALRSRIIPIAANATASPLPADTQDEETLADNSPPVKRKSKYIPWNKLLRRTFNVELKCADCKGDLRLIALVKTASDNRDESVRRTMALGASGFLPKSVRSRELADSLKWAVQHGRLPLAPDLAERLRAADTQETLTPREHEILREMARGASNEDIAGTMGVSLSTVKTHVNQVMVKLGASTRTGAVVVAARSGLIDVD